MQLLSTSVTSVQQAQFGSHFRPSEALALCVSMEGSARPEVAGAERGNGGDGGEVLGMPRGTEVRVYKMSGDVAMVLDREMNSSELQEKMMDVLGHYACTYKLVPMGPDLTMVKQIQDAEEKEEFLKQLEAECSEDTPPAANARSVFPAMIRSWGRGLAPWGGERINEVRVILQLEKYDQPLRDWQSQKREHMMRTRRTEEEIRARLFQDLGRDPRQVRQQVLLELQHEMENARAMPLEPIPETSADRWEWIGTSFPERLRGARWSGLQGREPENRPPVSLWLEEDHFFLEKFLLVVEASTGLGEKKWELRNMALRLGMGHLKRCRDPGIRLAQHAELQAGSWLDAFPELLQNRSFLLALAGCNCEDFHAVTELMQSKRFLKALLDQWPLALRHATSWHGDEDIVLHAVKRQGTCLQFASLDLRSRQDVAKAALRQDFRAFQYVDDSAKKQCVELALRSMLDHWEVHDHSSASVSSHSIARLLLDDREPCEPLLSALLEELRAIDISWWKQFIKEAAPQHSFCVYLLFRWQEMLDYETALLVLDHHPVLYKEVPKRLQCLNLKAFAFRKDPSAFAFGRDAQSRLEKNQLERIAKMDEGYLMKASFTGEANRLYASQDEI